MADREREALELAKVLAKADGWDPEQTLWSGAPYPSWDEMDENDRKPYWTMAKAAVAALRAKESPEAKEGMPSEVWLHPDSEAWTDTDPQDPPRREWTADETRVGVRYVRADSGGSE